jgi:hypothetical protein
VRFEPPGEKLESHHALELDVFSFIHDTHTALIAWGDGTTTAGVVAETPGSGSVVRYRSANDAVVLSAWLSISSL